MSESAVAERPGTGTGQNTFVDHWVKARIDSPLAALARMDDAAKQVAAVGGVLQAVLMVVIKLDHTDLTPYLGALAITGALALLLTIGLAVRVVFILPRDLDASGVYSLLSQPHTPGDVSEEIYAWCGRIKTASNAKRKVLSAAVGMLVLSLLVSFLCIVQVVMDRLPG